MRVALDLQRCITVINLQKFSIHEKKDMMYNLIIKYPDGLFIAEICRNTGMDYKTCVKLLNHLIDENKIRLVDYGNTKLYKVK